jgi:hypothetical protein
MSTSWISPGSRESSSRVVEVTWSAKAAESAALEAWRAAPVKVEAMVFFFLTSKLVDSKATRNLEKSMNENENE